MAVFAEYSISGANPVSVGGTGAGARKYFQAPSGNFTSGVSPNPGPSASVAYGQLNVPGDNVVNGQKFVIVAAGDFEVGSGGACPSVTIELVANTGTVVTPSWTAIASTGAITAQNLTGVFYTWELQASVVGTTKAGTLSGIQTAVVDNTIVAAGALTAVLSGLNFGSNHPVFGLAVAVTFSVSESGNSANMYQFQLSGD